MKGQARAFREILRALNKRAFRKSKCDERQRGGGGRKPWQERPDCLPADARSIQNQRRMGQGDETAPASLEASGYLLGNIQLRATETLTEPGKKGDTKNENEGNRL